MKTVSFTLFWFGWLLFLAQGAIAHEFIVKPDRMASEKNSTVGVSVLSAHVFMESEEVEPIEQVEVYAVSPKRSDVPLQVNEQEKSLIGQLNGNGGASQMLCGHRKPMIWTKTTEGWKQESKKNLKGVISSGVYEKFSKAYLAGKGESGLYLKPVGHRLEIVPSENPADIKKGEELKVQVLFDGKPIKTDLYATFDGFSNSPNTYAYFSTTDKDGMGNVKVTSDGTWMIRVQHEIEESSDDYDKHVLRAVFLFGVGGAGA